MTRGVRTGKRIVLLPDEAAGPMTRQQYELAVMKRWSETRFDQAVEQQCNFYGVWSYHAPKNVRRCRCGQYIRTASRAGWPDRTYILASGRVIFRELKKWDGRLEPEQREVIERLTAAGMDAKVWRPQDWAEIEQTLREGTAFE